MTSYKHLTTQEREMIFLYHSLGFSFRRIGRLIHRSPSTVMREIKRNSTEINPYSPSLAQKSYAILTNGNLPPNDVHPKS